MFWPVCNIQRFLYVDFNQVVLIYGKEKKNKKTKKTNKQKKQT